MAASFIMSVPDVARFLVLRNYFVRALVEGAVGAFSSWRERPGIPCHCEKRSDEAISCLTSRPWLVRQEIASSLRFSQ